MGHNNDKHKYSRTSLIRTPGDHQIRSSYPEFVLTDVICIEML